MAEVKVDFSALAKTKWHEYAVRFLLGGGITIAAGLIGKEYGPSAGGLFLAFPAIFPASATLIEKHETEKKPAPEYRTASAVGRPPRPMRAAPRGEASGWLRLVS